MLHKNPNLSPHATNCIIFTQIYVRHFRSFVIQIYIKIYENMISMIVYMRWLCGESASPDKQTIPKSIGMNL